MFLSPLTTQLSIQSALLAVPQVALSAKLDHFEDDPYPLSAPSEMTLFKNLTPYWVAASALAVWFLFIHSPSYLAARNVGSDLPFASHLVGAYTIYLACVANTLFTPSALDGKARSMHIWIGRVGLIAGFVGFFLGAYCAWWPGRGDKLPPFGFSLAISIGGCAQVVLQIAGYRAIKQFKDLKQQLESLSHTADVDQLNELTTKRDAALRSHISSMISLFVQACGIPALIRFLEMIGFDGAVGYIVGIVSLNLMVPAFIATYLKPHQSGANTNTYEYM